MGANLTTFEVRVRITGGLPIRYLDNYGQNQYPKEIKMFHVEARTSKQAINIKKKLGEIVSCRKTQVDRIVGNIESLPLNQDTMYSLGNPYEDAVAMNDMIWKKRNKRRKNIHKDKIPLDKIE